MTGLSTAYYSATIVFALLDFVLGVSVRASFLDQFPRAKLVYYAICVACLVLILYRPSWSVMVTMLESLTAVVALTLAIGVRVLVVTQEMIETGRGFVSLEELVNYLIVGGIAYYAYLASMQSLKESKIGKNSNS